MPTKASSDEGCAWLPPCEDTRLTLAALGTRRAPVAPVGKAHGATDLADGAHHALQ